MLKIIDNKKVEMTEDEWNLYNRICETYKDYGGKTLFHDLFESDDNGLIIFLKPPTKKHISFEIFLFLMSLFSQQHMRNIYKQVEDMRDQLNKKMALIEQKINEK